ncbi:MAG TPA: ABC transporter substrate-binding protein [Acidimicrobiales bacterium]|nr:ABC transporter substrate-binding protein [Acidimicrobiales bacterium]
MGSKRAAGLARHNTVFGSRRAAVAVATCVLVAGGSLTPGAVANAQGQRARGADASGATLVIADTSSVQKLDPDVVTNFLDFQALGLIYDQLVQYNNRLQLVADLATKWAYSDGNKVLTFQLRQGVKFDDGTTFTSANVVQSLERALNPKTADASASFLANVSKIVATGTYSVKFELSKPDTSILDGLTSVNLSMLSTKAMAAGTVAKTPDGTGPFMYSSWAPNNSFVMTANPSYWGGKVSIGSIKIETIPTEQSIASAVEAHTVQIGLLTEPQVALHLPKAIAVQKVLDLTYRALMLQDKSGPLANVDNRLAIACAVNRQQVVEDSVFGAGQVVGPVPLGEFASKPVSAVCPTPNLATAKSYLQKAQDPGGFSFTAVTSTDLDPTSAAQAIVVQGDLAKVGITMHISNLASDAYIQDWLKGDFQGAFAWNGADPNPYTMYGRYFGTGANLGVPAGYSSPQLQSLLAQGDAATTMAAQRSIWSKFSDALTSNAVWIWLFTAYDYAAVSSSVHGFTLAPTNSTTLDSLRSATFS